LVGELVLFFDLWGDVGNGGGFGMDVFGQNGSVCG